MIFLWETEEGLSVLVVLFGRVKNSRKLIERLLLIIIIFFAMSLQEIIRIMDSEIDKGTTS